MFDWLRRKKKGNEMVPVTVSIDTKDRSVAIEKERLMREKVTELGGIVASTWVEGDCPNCKHHQRYETLEETPTNCPKCGTAW